MSVLGVNVHPLWAEQSDPAVRAAIRDQLTRAGVTSVRIDFGWKDIEPDHQGDYRWDKLDALVTEYQAAGFSVLLMLYWAPEWSSGTTAKNGVPSSGTDFGNLAGAVARRHPDLAGIELWNEPDIDTFWAGTPAQFAQMAADAYTEAKRLAPAMTFLGAAPTYLGLANGWFEAMYDNPSYAPGRSYDAQAIHPYPSPSDLPPNAPASDWSINGIPQLQELRAAYGDTSPLWVTEVGWSTHDSPDSAENWKRGVTEHEQAAYTLGALILLQAYDIAACYLYTDRDMEQTTDPHERNFGLLRTDNSRKPVADLLAAVHAARPEPPDPETPPDPDLAARVDALELLVADLQDDVARIDLRLGVLAEHLASAAADLNG